jgi:hypothetical protein
VIEIRIDQRLKRAAWVANAADVLRVLEQLKNSLVSLVECGRHHGAIIETYGGVADNFVAAAEAWKAQRLDEALQRTKEIGDRVADMVELTKKIRTELDTAATLIDNGVNELADSLKRQMCEINKR